MLRAKSPLLTSWSYLSPGQEYPLIFKMVILRKNLDFHELWTSKVSKMNLVLFGSAFTFSFGAMFVPFVHATLGLFLFQTNFVKWGMTVFFLSFFFNFVHFRIQMLAVDKEWLDRYQRFFFLFTQQFVVKLFYPLMKKYGTPYGPLWDVLELTLFLQISGFLRGKHLWTWELHFLKLRKKLNNTLMGVR